MIDPIFHRPAPPLRGPKARRRRDAGSAGWSPAFDRLEDRRVMSAVAPFAAGAVRLPVDPTVQLSGGIALPGARELYEVTVDDDGLLVASVRASGFDTTLSLLDGRGEVLTQSQAISPTDPDDRIAQHLPSGTYYLAVEGRAGAGRFDLATRFTRASSPDRALSLGTGSLSVTTADLDGDRLPDLITADYFLDQILIDFGVGDGTFRPPVAVPAGLGPSFVLAGDFTGEGVVDLAVANQRSNTISILIGNGDGTFRAAESLATGAGPAALASGDFNGDGRVDLAVADRAGGAVEVFLGSGDGGFVEADRIGGLGGPASLAVADFEGDGHLDLAVANQAGGDLAILQGRGDGTFSLRERVPVGPGCRAVVAADFDGDGRPDLAAVSPDEGAVLVFENTQGQFPAPIRLAAGKLPYGLVAADLDGDGRPDLAAADYGSNEVSAFLGDGDGTFQPSRSLPTGGGPIALASADLDGDGRPELVTSDYISLTLSVLGNNGDGTFRGSPPKPTSPGPEAVVAADLNGDRIADLVVPNVGTNDVSVLLGRGDGTFRDPIHSPAGTGPFAVVVGDFDGDGRPDLAVGDFLSSSVTVLLGNGDGTFRTSQALARGDGVCFMKAADLDGDGRLDLVVANYDSNDASIFFGRGDGTFADQVALPVGYVPTGVAIGDFNVDGRPDLAVSLAGTDEVAVLLNVGGGRFAGPMRFPAGRQPTSVSAADLDGDGRVDLVVADYGTSGPSVVSILFGLGGGAFRPPVAFPVGANPYLVTVGDFDGDGRPDLLTGNLGSADLSLLLGRGDGTFEGERRLPNGTVPSGLAFADFDGDGHVDLAIANNRADNLSLDLGRGGGAFDGPAIIPLTASNLPEVVADLDGDGRTDAVVANPDEGTLTVLDGQGDGTFRVASKLAVGGRPSGLVAGDFNGDGRPDLAATDARAGDVLILLGLGDGTFRVPVRVHVGKTPRPIVAGDFNRDGVLDLAVANTGSNDLSVLLGRGDGTFRPERRYPVGVEPASLVVGDENGDGWLDLGTVNRSSHDITAFAGLPGGDFLPLSFGLPGIASAALVIGDFNGDGVLDSAVDDPVAGRVYVYLVGANPGTAPSLALDVGRGGVFMAAADIDRDGKSDLVVANPGSREIAIFGGWAAGSFRSVGRIPADQPIAGLAVADLNKDLLPDLLLANASTGGVGVYLARGDGSYSTPESAVPSPRPAPIVFPGASPGVSDIINVDDDGQILVRIGRGGAVAEFGSPTNATAGTGVIVRDFAYVRTGGAPAVADLDSQRPILYIQRTDVAGPAGLTALPLPGVGNYTRLISGDLFGTGRDDLVVINRTSNEILIFRQVSSGLFGQFGDPIRVGFGPTDVALAYLQPGALPDLVVANGSSGDVSIIARDSRGGFFASARVPAGLAAAGTIVLPDGPRRTSPDQPVGVASGFFGPSGLADVVVLDRGTDRISILKGLPGGGLAAPALATTYSTGLAPIQVVLAPLRPGGLLDIAVLNEGSHDISIFFNDGRGGFVTLPRIDAGNGPTALAVHDVTGDGVPDLVVSNAVGDILILSGRGDGTFRPYQRADRTVKVAVGDLTGDGRRDFVLSDASNDLLTVRTPGTSPLFLQDRGDGLLAPGPVAIADMDGDGIPDLIVTNTGGNDVLVYLGLGGGRFAPAQRFYTGTAPVGLTLADLTGNGLPDLVVANSGSNDVTLLLGEFGDDGKWTMVPGPRLKAGDRPISTTVADVHGDGIQDILVVNQDDNTLSVLRGLGGGFFDDKHPMVLATGPGPVQAFVGRFSASALPGIVVLNAQSNDMTYYVNVWDRPSTIATGGINPIAGVTVDFNRDGFADLAVANNGDSRITLFAGGTFGLTLAQSVTLGNSARPTDLVVSGTDGGSFRFFVGAEGRDRAIPIFFSVVTAIETRDPASAGGLVAPGGLAWSFAGNLFALVGFDASLFEGSGPVAWSRGQGVAPAVTQPGVFGTLDQVAALIATLTRAGQPLFLPSSRTLGWLLENLGRLDQGQMAEILPLGQGEMAAVAVLLSASGDAGPLEPPQPVPTEDEAPLVEVYLPDDGGTTPPSRLERFVANLDAPPTDVPSDVVTGTGRVREFGPEWVWRRRSSDGPAMTATFDDGTEGGPTRGPDDRGVDPDWVDAGHLAPEEFGEEAGLGEEPSFLRRAAATLAGAVALGVAIIGMGTIDRKALGDRWNRRARPARGAPIRERVGDGERPPAARSGSRTRPAEDLPPWLQGPMSNRVRRAAPVWNLAGTFFSRRGLSRTR